MMGRIAIGVIALVLGIALDGQNLHADNQRSDAGATLSKAAFESLRLAITDLSDNYGARYPRGAELLRRLDALEAAFRTGDKTIAGKLAALRKEALLANPLLDFDKLILLRRRRGQLGLPVNHKCNAGLKQTGYDNEIAVLSPVGPEGRLQTLFRPKKSEFVGEIDLHFNADRLLFSMPHAGNWRIWEIDTDGAGLRQLTRDDASDVDNFDACYLPDGGIVFASTASFHAVPCWHGVERACSLYRVDDDGANVRQLCFDQDLDLHPAVLPSGQVAYSRWDYSGTMHMYLRPLMVMNPDGTGQRAVYGSNSYWPNALYFPRGIPDAPNKIVAIVAGYHGVPRMGELVVVDLAKGWHEADGVLQRIPGRGQPIKPIIRDKLVEDSWPKFLHPFPLSDKYLLVAAQPDRKSPWGIYLVDVFDNILPICVDKGHDLFEPIPLRAAKRPPVIPQRVDLDQDDATVYVHDVYVGPGLAGVPRGTVKRLRIAAYHFGFPGIAGPDKIGSGGPWEAMRILGTVPVYEDGSASFKVPANTPLTIQPLDAEGKALQLMRSWYTAMPGERVSCVGCHEQPASTPGIRSDLAAMRTPVEIEPWRGPARGFDFEREVQPVLDQYCVRCHDDQAPDDGSPILDLRAERFVKNYGGRPLTGLGASRLHRDIKKELGGTAVRYTPAYDALVPYIRRVGIEDDIHLLVPGEYHADTSELIQLLKKDHYGVNLDREAWDRLVTWIDLNGPCHGTWGDVCDVPDGAARRRKELAELYGGPSADPESVPEEPQRPSEPIAHQSLPESRPEIPRVAGWPFDAQAAQRRQKARDSFEQTINLGDGVVMKLRRIPAGQFVMGSAEGDADERPLAAVEVDEDFWIGVCEVSGEQYRRFDPTHNSGRFAKRFEGPDGPGLSLDGSKRPVVRVSWQRAMAFCKWLSQITGRRFTLPTEAQWEYACRAGSEGDLSYGDVRADFSRYANVADKSLSQPPGPTGGLETNRNAHFGRGIFASAIHGSYFVCDPHFDDRFVATAPVGSYLPNVWGLQDMHGNAAEWTRTTYRPYPYRDQDGRNDSAADKSKVVRGGSWVDRPQRCRSSFRLNYPTWQRVHNVGFRVVCQQP